MRPESHKVGDLAEILAQEIFVANGWIVNRCLSDYGYDFFVMRDSDSSSRPAFALLQVKGLGGDLYGNEPESAHVQIKTKHIRQWNECPVPVFLCIVHVTARCVYVVSAREVVDALRLSYGPKWASAKSRRIKVLAKDVFSPEAAKKILQELENYWTAVYQYQTRLDDEVGAGCIGLPQLLFDWVPRLQNYSFQRRLRQNFGQKGSRKLLETIGIKPAHLSGWLILDAIYVIAPFVLWAAIEKLKTMRIKAR